MGIQIEDGLGKGIVTGVTASNQLLTQSESQELQHYESLINEQAYQVISVDTGITAATQTILHVRNDEITPQTGNTSMDAYVALICHIEDENE